MPPQNKNEPTFEKVKKNRRRKISWNDPQKKKKFKNLILDFFSESISASVVDGFTPMGLVLKTFLICTFLSQKIVVFFMNAQAGGQTWDL